MSMNIVSYLKKYPLQVSAFIFFTLAIVALQAYFPYVNKIIIDDIVSNQDYSLINTVVISVIIISLFICTFDIFKRFLITSIVENIQKNMKLQLLKKLRNKPFDFIIQKNEGYLLSYFQSDVSLVISIYRDILPLVVQIFFQITISFFIVVYVNYKLLFLGIIIVVVNVLVMKSFSKRIEGYSIKYQHQNGNIHKFLSDTMRGSNEIVNFNAKTWEKNKFEKLLLPPITTSLKLTKSSSFSLNINQFIYWFSFALLTLFGLNLVKDNEMTIGLLIATTTYFMSLLNPVLLLFELGTEYQRALGGLKRLNELMLGEEYRGNRQETNCYPLELNCIEVENLSYSYPGLNKDVLQNVNFSATKGEITLIKGISGEGKSTLVNILSGLLLPSSGGIFLDNQDMQYVSEQQLREYIKVVFQHPHFFNATLMENLIFDNSKITEERVIEVLRGLNCYEFVFQFEQGLNTKLDGDYRKLSGGQKQRLALARAILSNPKILILDEPTAGLDGLNEASLFHYLKGIKKEMIIILISHSKEAELFSDKIYELNQGSLKEISTTGGDVLVRSN
jgi:ABC-type bacteriocin/lantibiotic exporter with double-glycine peptidase domain